MNNASLKPLLSIALPVYRNALTLPRAFEALATQTLSNLEILIVLNGSDAGTTEVAEQLAAKDSRVRILTLPNANQSVALNLALREASSPIVARMDADDTCPPERLERQYAYFMANPRLAALGCEWEQVSQEEDLTAIIRPPTDPAEARWRLLLSNPFAHGSMMLRRDAVLSAGGYDESLERSQDYDLWLRLSSGLGVAAMPGCLYRFNLRPTLGVSASTAQADTAARLMFRAWRQLPDHHPDTESGTSNDASHLIARAMSQGPGSPDALRELETLLTTRGPSRELLHAWLWMQHSIPPMSRRAMEFSKSARVREVARYLHNSGIRTITLWGAGAHSAWLIPRLKPLGITVTGLVDDAHAGGTAYGLPVRSPKTLEPGQHVLLSSDSQEDRLNLAAEGARARGVIVHRIYG